ncbi:putative Coiled-coil domain-containing protein 65 [Hypsibius exemplaris]|uniref:Coiled-coil domain-containing protein 65 n=1 Tax=Hypsibius exemplaris TaxID=2072580 RepID=A0A1W0WGQ5_HYPEX|nr:putative Coiled-coil domain-containing protein 65 [Hypsibius exemplaris]
MAKSKKEKKGEKEKMLPWVRQWRRSTVLNNFQEDTANFERNLAQDAFKQLLVQHRPHLRRVRRRELHEEMRQTILRTEQEMDRREDVIGFLMSDMKEAFAQEELLAQRHTAALNRLVEIHEELRAFMEEEFYGNLRTLLAELCAKTNMLSKQNDDELKKLEVMKKILDEEWAEEETERRTKFLTSLDEIKNGIMEEKQILRIQMEQVITDLYQKMEDEYVKYRNRTEEKLIRYQELRAKDEISSKEVKYQVMRINMLSKQVALRKSKLASFRQSAEVKMRYWEELKGRLKAETGVVKGRIRTGNLKFQTQYRDMTISFQSVHDRLFELEKLGVRLVRHALASHRMQDPDDKLYASSQSHLTKQEQVILEKFKKEKPIYEMNKDVGDMLKMAPFMMNNAHMEMKNIARTFENKQLRSQNARLEGLIREYVRDKTVTGEVLQDRLNNPLLTTKGPTYIVVDRPTAFRTRRLTRISNAPGKKRFSAPPADPPFPAPSADPPFPAPPADPPTDTAKLSVIGNAASRLTVPATPAKVVSDVELAATATLQLIALEQETRTVKEEIMAAEAKHLSSDASSAADAEAKQP